MSRVSLENNWGKKQEFEGFLLMIFFWIRVVFVARENSVGV